MGTVFVDELARARLRGFALAFDRLRKTKYIRFQRMIIELHLVVVFLASVQNLITRSCCDNFFKLVLVSFAIDLLLAQDHWSKVCVSSSHLAQAMG